MVGYRKFRMCKAVTSQVIVFEFISGVWSPVMVKRKWNGVSPSVCVSCAVQYIKQQSHGRILGHVYPTHSKNYLHSVFGADSFARTFYRDGIVVIPGLKMMGHAKFTDAISLLVARRNLRERCKLQLLKDSIENGKKTHHEDRRWINIWGDSNSLLKSDTEAATLLKLLPGLVIELERHLFPEVHIKRKMGDVNVNTSAESTLECTKINLLARFAGLNNTQFLHRDDEKFGLVVIYIFETDGYSFKYVKGSHELSYIYDNVEEARINVMKSDERTIIVPRDHFICFATNLVHAGGPASKSKKVDSKEDPSSHKLSDLSFHFDFSHSGLSKGAYRGNGVQLAWPYEPHDDNESLPWDPVFKHGGDSPKFREAVVKATTAWISNKRIGSTRSTRGIK